jgi:hypothetical protein
MSTNATINYEGHGTRFNATVLPAELRSGIEKQKKDHAASVAANIEYKRVPKGTRKLKHQLPEEETYNEDGEKVFKKSKTVTTRKDR